MLAKLRQIVHQGQVVGQTPMLVPSFSSKGVPQLGGTANLLAPFIDGPVLFSAYDLIHGKRTKDKIRLPITFPEIAFLDSGGYEVSKDHEDLEPFYGQPTPKNWNKALHQKGIGLWRSTSPTVLITYDHPRRRLNLKNQFKEAESLFKKWPHFIPETLIKPEKPGKNQYIKPARVLEHASECLKSSILGFTEKELGRSILERMVNIALIRKGLEKLGNEIPIHIFGNLDPITTPLYFMAGADIFDGLTWLRYAFLNGALHYQLSHGAVKFDPASDEEFVASSTWVHNLGELKRLQSSLKKFASNQDFSVFGAQGENGDFFKQTYDLFVSKLAKVEP